MFQFKSLRTVVLITFFASMGAVQGGGLLDDHYNVLSKRLTANVCATINPGIDVYIPLVGTEHIALASSTCLCLSGGVLTPTSIASLKLSVQTSDGTGTVLGDAVAALGLTNIVNLFDSAAITLLGAQPDSGCNYPSGAIPRDCGTCNYDCPNSGFVCGSTCVDAGSVCVSGKVVKSRRRSLDSSPFLCPKDLTACAIPGSNVWTGHNFECIDTQNDIESCGACADPIPGQPMGQDCTAIQNTNRVACQQGACAVLSCQRGYEVDSTGTSCIAGLVNQSGNSQKRSGPRRARF
ncbi:hypothetical protein BCR39DRAFT_546691 [Naematelia encephala]|uniref:Protein CPL1-like domain-containing protein n=1 Tax=Naematelia encephala TaxID=71784 RepID=A0A1Y2AQ80_9TREE|nr:hypothetical protein BCR39DRAFT_546691 [Naematelia encephala]